MEFWLSFNNGSENLQLPVNPRGFEVNRASNNSTISVIDLGEINLIGKAGLARFPINSFFPKEYNQYCRYRNIPKPMDCIKLIEKWMQTGKPIRLKITDTLVNTPVTIESFTYGQSDAFGNVSYALDLLEYRFIKTSSKDVTDRASKEPPKSYVVRSDDNLHLIAKKTTGSSSNWKRIADANKINNGRLMEGQVLTIS